MAPKLVGIVSCWLAFIFSSILIRDWPIASRSRIIIPGNNYRPTITYPAIPLQYRNVIPASVDLTSASACLYKHSWIKRQKNKPSTSSTQVACKSKLHSVVRSSMHLYPGGWVVIRRTVVYNARIACTFSAKFQNLYCTCQVLHFLPYHVLIRYSIVSGGIKRSTRGKTPTQPQVTDKFRTFLENRDRPNVYGWGNTDTFLTYPESEPKP